MAYNNRRFFPNESIEEKTKKYTRPHPIVTSHLRNMQQTFQNTPPVWMSTRLHVPITNGLLIPPSNIPPTVVVPPQASNTQIPHVLSVQKQLIANRKRRYGPSTTNETTLSKKKYEPKENCNHNPTRTHNADKYEKLTAQLKNFADRNTQPRELLEKKLCLRSALLTVFRRELSGASLHLVGSSCNGFASLNSDADFCVMLTQNRQIDQKYEACYYLRKLQNTLRSISSIRKIVLIRAKVPILKFNDLISGCECDVNINNATGIRNTHLLRSYSKVDDRVKPLVIVVKNWAKTRQINDAASGLLSSYSLVLMVIHYLQCGCSPPVLMSLQKEYSQFFTTEKSVDELPMFEPSQYIPCNSSSNLSSLGELYIGFFKYYTKNFRWDQDAASVRLGSKIPKTHLVEYGDKYIGIEEPFDRTNTARTVYRYDNFQKILNEFKRAYETLSEGHPSMYSIL